MDFCTSFTCPARYCELLSDDLVSDADFIEKLISQALNSDPLKTFLSKVEICLSIPENVYIVKVHVWCNVHSDEIPNRKEIFILVIEAVISQILLQCFWEIYYYES